MYIIWFLIQSKTIFYFYSKIIWYITKSNIATAVSFDALAHKTVKAYSLSKVTYMYVLEKNLSAFVLETKSDKRFPF